MQDQLKQKLLTKFPEWHKQPLRLSIAEMEDPYSVLTFFFECYRLPDIRTCLKELLNDSLCSENVEASKHMLTHDDTEKLIEAAWLIYKQRTKDTLNNQNSQEEKELIQEENADNEILDCYKKINEFFDAFSLPFARRYILSALQAAESDKIWKKAAPTDLMYFFECLEGLLPVVFTIVKSDYKNNKVLLPFRSGFPDLTQHLLYCGNNDQREPWEYFPRNLSVKEYHDPYKALQKITKWSDKKEWKQIFQYLLSYSLGANSLSEFGVHLELVKISELLQKMLDACHLIHVRTTMKTN